MKTKQQLDNQNALLHDVLSTGTCSLLTEKEHRLTIASNNLKLERKFISEKEYAEIFMPEYGWKDQDTLTADYNDWLKDFPEL